MTSPRLGTPGVKGPRVQSTEDRPEPVTLCPSPVKRVERYGVRRNGRHGPRGRTEVGVVCPKIRTGPWDLRPLWKKETRSPVLNHDRWTPTVKDPTPRRVHPH